MSGISGRSDGLYKAVNAKSAGTIWTSADLSPVAGGLGALMASNDYAISLLNSNIANKSVVPSNAFTMREGKGTIDVTSDCRINNKTFSFLLAVDGAVFNNNDNIMDIASGYRPLVGHNIMMCNNSTGKFVGIIWMRANGVCTYYGDNFSGSALITGDYLV